MHKMGKIHESYLLGYFGLTAFIHGYIYIYIYIYICVCIILYDNKSLYRMINKLCELLTNF